MKRTSYINLILLMVILFLVAFTSQKKIEKSNSIKEILEKMHLIEGSTTTVGLTEFTRITANDSTLLFWNVPTRQTVNAFYISATEVTNVEWREFYLAMSEELGLEKAGELYYPDTLVWIKDFPFSYMKPLANNYFQDPIFNDYPVVGVSWIQAQDYCKWKTQMVKSISEKRKELVNIRFRLPTQNEWEFAASGHRLESREGTRNIYPWKGYNYQKDGKYLANFGKIEDTNKAIVKTYHADDGLNTTAVGKYPPNLFGLYDVAGNVAEWVADTAKIYDIVNEAFIYKLTDIDALIQYFENQKKSHKDESNLYEYYKKNLIHDREILSKGDMRLVKGGAWSDGLAYLQVGSKEAMVKEKKSSSVGFRVAVSYDKKHEKYFPKKYWQPKK